jgi:pilus assembly protein CpaB
MKSKRRIIGILASVILATIGTLALVGYVQSAKDKAVAEETLIDVYMVDKLVPKGAEAETIKSSVSVEHVPPRLKQPGAITDLAAVGDNVAATDLQPGDQLLAARLIAPDQVAVEIKDKVQISAAFSSERAVGGSLQAGDLVGVYLSFDPFDLDKAGEDPAVTGATDGTQPIENTLADSTGAAVTAPEAPKSTPNVTRLEFQHVLVTDIQAATAPVVSDENDEKDITQVSSSQYVVTLALSPEQSERFVFATEFGHVWLSNDPATVSDDGTRLVTLGNVFSVVK